MKFIVATVLIQFALAVSMCARELDSIVGFNYAEIQLIASNALRADVYISEVKRNAAGTVLYANCTVGFTNNPPHATVMITTTNVSSFPSKEGTSFSAAGTLDHWFDGRSREWVFSSGTRYSISNTVIATSPDGELIAVGQHGTGVKCLLRSTTNVLLTLTDFPSVERIDGTSNDFRVVVATMPGPRVRFHVFHCTKSLSGSDELKEYQVPWADSDADMDGSTGEIIFHERTVIFPAVFEFNPDTGTKQKLKFSRHHMMFVNRELAQHLKRLNPKVRIQDRK